MIKIKYEFKASEPVVGVYDPVGDVYSEVITAVKRDVVTIPTKEPDQSYHAAVAHLRDKSLLLNRSTHIIVVVRDMSSLSILIGAVHKLLAGSLQGALIVSPFPIEELLKLAAIADEYEVLCRCAAEGRFSIMQQVSRASIDRLLASAL